MVGLDPMLTPCQRSPKYAPHIVLVYVYHITLLHCYIQINCEGLPLKPAKSKDLSGYHSMGIFPIGTRHLAILSLRGDSLSPIPAAISIACESISQFSLSLECRGEWNTCSKIRGSSNKHVIEQWYITVMCTVNPALHMTKDRLKLEIRPRIPKREYM